MCATAWAHLLGLPVDQALSLLGGAQARIVSTCAPRREHDRPPEDGPRTQRVIRVCETDGTIVLTVSAFPDGAPRQA